jgi:tartronate-semialdehyde synthase
VVVVGDAGLLFMVEELAMAGQHKLPVIIVVVNNGYLGLIRQNQKYAYGYEHGVSLWYCDGGVYPDYVKIAEGFGGRGERVHDPNELPAAFARAMDSGVSYLIDVIVERECDCSMGASIDAVREFS